jgi:hypothetical protein
MADYEDSRITLDAGGLSLRMYYFPFGSKHIQFDRIAKVHEHDMGTGIGGGRWRIWGSGDLVHWMPLDAKRPKKKWMYIFRLKGSAFRPCVTPDDPEAFKAALTSRGIDVQNIADPYED